MLNKCASVLAKLLLITIRLYQLLVVPLLPRNCCRYYPSCSNYAASAIHKYGVLRGIWFALKRLLRCHPGASGGYDPLP